MVPEGATFTCAARCSIGLLKKTHFLETSPLRNNRCFWQPVARLDWARRRHGFLLHTVTRLLRPQLPHYYGFICHLTPRQLLLELPLEVTYRSHRLYVGCRTMPGFPSYSAGSLLMITSSITCCRCSCIGHHVFLHTRPDNRPNQVHFRYVPSTSYRFLQTPPLASDALASQIHFPMNRVWSLTKQRLGLPASLGKQKKLLIGELRSFFDSLR